VDVPLSISSYPTQSLVFDGKYKQFKNDKATDPVYITPAEFISTSVTCSLNVCNQDFWTNAKNPTIVDSTDANIAAANVSEYFVAYGTQLYNKIQYDSDSTYGNIMVNSISATSGNNIYKAGYDGSASYSLVMFLNSTSKDVLPIWSAYAHELIFREFLSG
jgi:hypothetical protein